MNENVMFVSVTITCCQSFNPAILKTNNLKNISFIINKINLKRRPAFSKSSVFVTEPNGQRTIKKVKFVKITQTVFNPEELIGAFVSSGRLSYKYMYSTFTIVIWEIVKLRSMPEGAQNV